MKQISLSGKKGKDKYALVDDADYHWLLSIGKWHLSDTGYAVIRTNVREKKRTLRMHRLVNDTPMGMVTDHINRNRLDNRSKNLRTVTHAENSLNRDRGLGVWFQKQNNNWVVELQDKHIGVFSDFGLAYQIAEMVRNGELPMDGIKEYTPFCKYGHNKEESGTYKISGTLSCRVCVLDNQKRYHERKNGK